MSASVERQISFSFSDGKAIPRQETTGKDSWKGVQLRQQIVSNSSPASVMSLSKIETAAPNMKNASFEQKIMGHSACGVNNVIQKLQRPPISSKTTRKIATCNTRKQLSTITVTKPHKRKRIDSQSNKPALKKSHATLTPPTLASCNRHVIGANLRLPRSFTTCSKEDALKYSQMCFPFSDRHNCALVPTAIFSYGRSSSLKLKSKKTNQSKDMKPKYSFRRRVWLLVPHRLAPAEIRTRKVHGPPRVYTKKCD